MMRPSFASWRKRPTSQPRFVVYWHWPVFTTACAEIRPPARTQCRHRRCVIGCTPLMPRALKGSRIRRHLDALASYRQLKGRRLHSLWMTGRIRKSTVWRAGAVPTSRPLSSSATGSGSQLPWWGACSKNLASRMSVRTLDIPNRSRRKPKRLKKILPDQIHEITDELSPGAPIELWFQDEMRVGQKNNTVYQWARRGTRPRQPADQR